MSIWAGGFFSTSNKYNDHCKCYNNGNSAGEGGYQKAKVKVKPVTWLLLQKVHVFLEEAKYLAGNCRFGNEASLV
jgi:hypothetical protein